MHPIPFEGAKEVGKPQNMTDEQCFSVWAKPIEYPAGVNEEGEQLISRMWVEAWKPSYEDLKALNNGGAVWLQIHSLGLPPVAIFTVDENGNSNDAG